MTHTINLPQGALLAKDCIPERFVVVLKVDGVYVDYCDNNIKRVEFKQDWMKTLNEDCPQEREWHTQICMASYQILKGQL